MPVSRSRRLALQRLGLAALAATTIAAVAAEAVRLWLWQQNHASLYGAIFSETPLGHFCRRSIFSLTFVVIRLLVLMGAVVRLQVMVRFQVTTGFYG